MGAFLYCKYAHECGLNHIRRWIYGIIEIRNARAMR